MDFFTTYAYLALRNAKNAAKSRWSRWSRDLLTIAVGVKGELPSLPLPLPLLPLLPLPPPSPLLLLLLLMVVLFVVFSPCLSSLLVSLLFFFSVNVKSSDISVEAGWGTAGMSDAFADVSKAASGTCALAAVGKSCW